MLSFLLFFSLSAQAQFNGVPFRDDVARCEWVTDSVTAEQEEVIASTIGQHAHRLYHWLWHATRNGWNSLTEADRAIVTQISPQWGQHQPLCQPGSAAGEEFLRMHHQMIDYLRSQLVAAGQPCITGWTEIPTTGIPVGDPRDSSKSAEMGHLIQVWSKTFMDPEYLRRHTLAEIGHLVEFSIHNNLHMRFALLPLPGDDFSPILGGSTVSSILQPSGYEGPSFRYLGNPYSAAVNPNFWKIHGWVDNVVVAWLAANGYRSIADDCGGDPFCYQWRSQWIGGMSSGEPIGGGHGHDHHKHSSDVPARDGSIGSLRVLTGHASFRNRAFDAFLREPKGGAGEPTASPYEDPAAFVRDFGPCR